MSLNPGISAIFSFFFNGLGQLYNGQIKKGLWLIFFSCLSMLILVVGALFIGYWLLTSFVNRKELILGVALFSLGLIFICIIGIYSIFDAYKTAKEFSKVKD